MAFQGDSIYWVEVEKVVPNPFQPRREFDQNKLQELADSIRMYGVLQPLTVTRKEVQREDGTFYTEYELIAGERRLRASKLAGTAQVPVIIREGEQSEQEKLELAIIENLQREDLNAVDRALAFKQLAEMFGLSHAQVAQKVGRSREYVSNSIRLLGLPENILQALKHGELSEGHSRTLLMLNDRPEEQDVIFREILLKKMSVREVERIVRKIATDKVRKKTVGDLDSNLIEYEKQFTETLGTRVQIQKTDFGGKLTIDYFSVEDLEQMLERMKREAAETAASEGDQYDSMDRLTNDTPLEEVADSRAAVSAAATAPAMAESAPDPAVESPEPPEVPNMAPAPAAPTTPPETTPAAPAPTPAVAAAEPAVEKKPWYQAYTPFKTDAAEEAEQAEVTETTDAAESAPAPAPTPAPTPQPPVEPPVAVEPPQVPTAAPAPVAPTAAHQPPFARYSAPSFQAPAAPQPVAAPRDQSPAQSVPTYARPDTPAPAPQPAPAPEKTTPTEDESSLYSIRNFNV